MLKQRVITAAIGLPLLVGGLLLGPASAVYAFLLVCSSLAVYEIAQLIFPPCFKLIESQDSVQAAPPFTQLTLFCVIMAALVFLSATLGLGQAKVGGITAVLSLMMLMATFSGSSIPRSVIQVSGSVLSICYGCLPWLCIWDLYLLGAHSRYLLLLLVVVMMGDSGAYFAGLKFGRYKLAPRYSPKKTWEGLLGGLLSSVGGCLLLNLIYGGELGPWWLLCSIALLAGIAGSLGDLVESAFKRFAQVKDSGAIFPGHGGFLDRVDALLFAAPVVWLLVYSYHKVASL